MGEVAGLPQRLGAKPGTGPERRAAVEWCPQNHHIGIGVGRGLIQVGLVDPQEGDVRTELRAVSHGLEASWTGGWMHRHRWESQTRSMATFVLVHGAMLGGWCWRDVTHRLLARGHEVFTPTLTGQGERQHLLTADVGVATHARDVLQVLDFEDLHQAHLVLHGYSGILAGPIAGGTDRLASVTYLGAYMAGPGESLRDVAPDGCAGEQDWAITDQALRLWAHERATAFPCRWMEQRVDYGPAALAALPQAYVRHTQPPVPSLEPSWQGAVLAGLDTYEVSCGHAMMITAPRQTARLLETTGPRDGLPPVFPASPRIALW